MSDLNETPAVPESDTLGDERAGLFAAGGVLVAIGWGAGIGLNVLFHAIAPVGGIGVGPVHVFSTWGAFAWATAGIGLLTGAVGAATLYVARSAPKGGLVLPGLDY